MGRERLVSMGIEFMKEEDVLALLENEEDVLAPKTKLGPKKCPLCGAVLTFVAGEREGGLLRCIACETEMDPETGVISRLGLVSKARDVGFQFIRRA